MGITIKTKKSRILVCIILFDFVCAVYAQNPPSQGSLEQILGQPEVQKKIEGALGKAKQLSDAVNWVLKKLNPLREKIGIIPKEVEVEMYQLLSRLISSMDEKKYKELVEKYGSKSINLTQDQIREKLLNDPEFRKEMTERISCSLYRVFRSFGWHSAAEVKQGEVDKYYERLRLSEISMLQDPISEYIHLLVQKLGYTFFDADGTIRIDGSKAIHGECAAAIATVQLLQSLFPQTWQYLLDKNQVNELYAILEQAKTISWELNIEYPGIIELGLQALNLTNNRLDNIHEQKSKNVRAIRNLVRSQEQEKKYSQVMNRKKRYADQFNQYKKDPLFDLFKEKNDVEKALATLKQREEERVELARKFGLETTKDTDVIKLLHRLSQYRDNMPKSIEILSESENNQIIAQDAPNYFDQKVYKALFNELGIYKLIDLTDNFVELLNLPKDKVGLKKYNRLRKLLNLYVVLRQKEMGTRYQDIVEFGLEIINIAFKADSVKRARIEKVLESLYHAILRHDKTKIDEIRKYIKKFKETTHE